MFHDFQITFCLVEKDYLSGARVSEQRENDQRAENKTSSVANGIVQFK
jgi:hypothetical protein